MILGTVNCRGNCILSVLKPTLLVTVGYYDPSLKEEEKKVSSYCPWTYKISPSVANSND